ncbi:unnamed protein product, partial [marine sediment metagenome]
MERVARMQRITSVIVVESLPLWQEALVGLLSNGLGLRVLAATARLDEGLRLVRARRPGLIVLDRDAPPGDVFAVVRSIRSLLPSSWIVLTAAKFSSGDLELAKRTKVRACLLKTAEARELKRVFRSVVGKRARASASLRKRSRSPSVNKSGRVSPRARLKSLTERELEVLRYVARGLTVAEIARRLERSPKTVDAHK